MATPTLTNPPTTISNCDLTTGWTISGSAPTQDTEFKKEGSASNSGILRNDLATAVFTGAGISMANQHVRCWINFTATAFLDVEANSGMEFYMTDGSNTAYWVVFGSNTYLGGWKNVIVDFEGTPSSGTKPTGNVTSWGFRFNRTAAPRQSINTWVDALRYGDGYIITGGTSGDRITLDNVYTVDAASSYAVVDRYEGIYLASGKLTLGNGATTTYINWANSVLLFVAAKVHAGLYGIVGQGSGCTVTITASVLQAAGLLDNQRFIVDMDDANLAALTFTNNFLTRASTIYFKAGQTCTGNTFDNCGQITAGGANLSGSIVKNYEGTADTAAVVWNVNTDPDTYLGSSQFIKGTAATHAIQLGTSSPTTVTVRGITFTGYNASNGQNDSTILVSRTTGSVTINVVGCSGNVSYKSAGATVNLILNPVTFTVAGMVPHSEVRIYQHGTTTELAGTEDIGVGSSFGYAYTYSPNVYVDLVVMAPSNSSPSYLYYRYENYLLTSADASFTVQQQIDRQYSNP